MKRTSWLSAALALGLTGAAGAANPTSPPAQSATPSPMKTQYPPTKAQDIVDTLHGTRVADPYRWLENAADPEVQAWMTAQDQLARAELAKLPGRDRLVERLKQLYYYESMSPPKQRGGRLFYTRRHVDKEKAVLYWRAGARGAEHVLLDPNTLSADGSTSVGRWEPSYDGKRVVYALHANNSDEATFYVREVASGKVSRVDVIEGVKYADPVWTPSSDGFYYVWVPPPSAEVSVADRPGFAEVRFHKLGTPPQKDPVIHEKTGNPQTFAAVDLSRDGRWLFYTVSHGWNSTDIYFRDLNRESLAWQPLVVGQPALYNVVAWKGAFYVTTNEGAPRSRVLRVDPLRPERANWHELVPERNDATLEHAEVRGGHLALAYTKNAASLLEIHTLDGKPVRTLPLPALGDTRTSVGGSEYGLVGSESDDDAYFAFSSFTQPPTVYRTSIAKGGVTVFSQVKLPIDNTPYVTEQVWYPSKDGTQVSMFVVHRKDEPADGSTPYLLTGYGGFNVSELPGFQAAWFAWLELGGGFAVPNLRGGGEYGEEWHKAGMGAKKQNVFDDFAAAARWLIDHKHTSAQKLAIMGGSNGGLLMGAAITQHPELFRAVACGVPLLDMVRYHLFGSGKTWVPEYGSAEDAAQFATLYAYSPYHHVKTGGAYPAVLMMSADADDRVDPLHARKMAALLQARSGSGRPVWLRIERHSGHGGADLARQAVEASADRYAFFMHELGMAAREHK